MVFCWLFLTLIYFFKLQALNLFLVSYNDTKQYSPFVAKTLGSVENVTSYAVDKASPLYQTYLVDKGLVNIHNFRWFLFMKSSISTKCRHHQLI